MGEEEHFVLWLMVELDANLLLFHCDHQWGSEQGCVVFDELVALEEEAVVAVASEEREVR